MTSLEASRDSQQANISQLKQDTGLITTNVNNLQEEIDQLEGREASSESKLSNIQSEVVEVQQDTSQLSFDQTSIKKDIQQINGSLWSNHRSTKGKKSSWNHF